MSMIMDSPLLDEWLQVLARAQWTFHYVPDRTNPDVIGAVLRWRQFGMADVIIIFDEHFAWCYRTLTAHPDSDPFDPHLLLYSSTLATPARTIREALTIPAPHDDHAPTVLVTATEHERRDAARLRGTRRVIVPPQR